MSQTRESNMKTCVFCPRIGAEIGSCEGAQCPHRMPEEEKEDGGRHDTHYTDMAIEPMHRSLENGLDAAQHTICKYVERHKVKGGIRDLEAARDLLIDYIEYVKTGHWKGKHIAEISNDW